MPVSPSLSALFNLRPTRAADFLQAKGLRLTGPYWELDGPAHRHTFTVANLAKIDVLADIKSAVQEAIDTGQTGKWFEDQLKGTLQKKGWWGPLVHVDPDTLEARIIQAGSTRRLKTIYSTNLQNAYMAGRHRQAMEQIDRAPWAQYLAIRDQRSRPHHAEIHGKVFRLDSPEWAVIAPPRGYNCRCRARYLSQRELDKRGLTPADDVRIVERAPPGNRPMDPLTAATPERWLQRGISLPDPANPGGRIYSWTDPNWDHLPGSDGAERALVDKLMATADEIGEGVREAVLARALQQGIPFYPAITDAIAAPSIVLRVIGNPSAAMVARVRQTLDDLPDMAKHALSRDLARVVVGRTLTGACPSLKGKTPRGWPKGATWDNADGCASGTNGRAYVAERYRDFWAKGRPWQDAGADRTSYVVQHELGHALDAELGHESFSDGFRSAHQADVKRAKDNGLKIDDYFLQEDEAGPSETFAEQFMNVVAGKGDMQMPETYAYLRAILGLGGTQ